MRFAVVGTIGFVVDAGALYGLVHIAGFNPYTARLISFLLAATTTWALNRLYTFQHRHNGNVSGQWLQYLLIAALGGSVNYATYAWLLFTSAWIKQHLIIGVAAGSIAGLAVNFTAARYWVFRAKD